MAAATSSFVSALDAERRRGSVNVTAMTHFLDGGARATELHDRAMGLLAGMQEPTPSSLAEARAQTLAHVDTFYDLFLEHGSMDVLMRKAMVRAFSLYDMGWYIRNGVHFGLFLSAITSQGNKDQQNEWLPKVLMREIYGCFAMTELGHGSAVAALETTATFDPRTREFILDTPVVTATKWMIGAAGESATHAAVYAQLVLNGVKKGLHVFVAPVRSLDPPHAPLPGVLLGDCGVKMGLNGVDNGWIQFRRVRVPYDHFLSRFASISKDNEYIAVPATTAKPSTALIATRGELVMLSISMLKKALTISVRYGAVRTQGVAAGAMSETTLLDYPSHQRRLLPLIATAYAYHFQATYIESLIDSIDHGINVSRGDDSALAEVHGTMAGLKAFCTWDTLAAIESCRQCCGGNGYLGVSGLGEMVADFSVMVTFEGDNTVMAQQTGAYVCRAYDAYCQGRPSLAYLTAPKTMSWAPTTVQSMQTVPALRSLLDFYAATKAQRVYDLWRHARTTSDRFPCQVEWMDVARVHVFHAVAMRFLDNIVHLTDAGSSLARVLTRLASLFVLSEVEKSGAFFLAEGFLSPTQYATVRGAVLELCKELRPDAVLLVDAFNLHDVVLRSALGRFDGNVYPAILSHL
ncbi:hypothetical protein SPRG_04262 [Saprolegnia parasitica CBS 223.65]|uniref:Acyl-coenzyme A oxidase n=1 Tax=Saprolegnia parasitica (strain CBS 223.65) TaxID=695850 RepID=A0A067CKS1_SAPPC|nr:hypothetical protein SPRG_04262 [Saprolegnia parasitica CBS 223.65]KDO31123.1 hypothetical protein SPRG_04262 [Saprolegnia parasitica CBS 223.65]|eukprot:XP_012198252.1 hypothetical protein SPRG_04262 [Saprolegnia parasitica CBS 223.65]